MSDLQAALDHRLEEALQISNYRLTLQHQLEVSKLKLQQQLTVSINGGTFKVEPNLITFVYTLILLEQQEVILLDVNGNPIKITDLPSFQEMIMDTYHEAHNDYYIERQRLRKSRNPSSVVGLV